MNKLVEHMIINHHPGGNAIKIVEIEQLLKETGFTVEELHHMAMEAYNDKLLTISRSRIKDNRWGIDRMVPGDIQHIGIYGSVIRKLENKNKG